MWDEKKFFEDFKRESDSIEPNPQFVENMTKLVNNADKPKGASFRKKVYVWQTAAAVVLVCGIGAFAANMILGTEPEYRVELQAGKNPQADVQMSGSFGEQKAADICGRVAEIIKEQMGEW